MTAGARRAHDMRSDVKLTVLALFAVCLISSGSARADTVSIADPLLGHCLAGCADNGTNTSISGPVAIINDDGTPSFVSPLTGFYFQASPGPQTGYMHIDILVPDNARGSAGPISIISGGPGGKVGGGLIDGTWTTGTLGAFIGAANGVLNPSPGTPIGAYLPATQALDPGATGFRVYNSSSLYKRWRRRDQTQDTAWSSMQALSQSAAISWRI
jgi:hypothetical protein